MISSDSLIAPATSLDTPRAARLVIGAALTTAAALWVTRASFDMGGPSDAPIRVAMLPSLPELAGLTLLVGLLVALLAYFIGINSALVDGVTPLYGLATLLIPFLPWLADWAPSLRLLAGPGKYVIWMVVVGQVALAIGRYVAPRARMPQLSNGAAAAVVFGVSAAAFAWVHVNREGHVVEWPAIGAAAAAAALVWFIAERATRSKAAATFTWTALCLSTPLVVNAARVPEAMLTAAAALVAVALVAGPTSILVIVPAAFFGLLLARWQMIDGALPSLGWDGAINGALGLLFDQEFGLWISAPVAALAVFGVAAMVRRPGERTKALVISATFVGVLILAGSAAPWWQQPMMPGAPVVALLPLLAVPIAKFYQSIAARPLPRAGAEWLLLVTLAMTVVAGGARREITLEQYADGSASLLEWLSPTWHLPTTLPTYIEALTVDGPLRTGIWLAGILLISWLLARRASIGPGAAALVSSLIAFSLTPLTAGAAWAIAGDPERQFNVESRSLVPALETFDAVRRPIGIRYDPLTLAPATDIPRAFVLGAVPGQRRVPQPIPVLLNARFRLPSGQYDVVFTARDDATLPSSGLIGLQIGRDGNPLDHHRIALRAGAQQSYRFALPLDAEFLAFRAEPQIGHAIGRLQLTPRHVVNASERFSSRTVLGAAAFASKRVMAFFHDSDVYAEKDGFWVRGRSTAEMTVVTADGPASALALTVHSGNRPNRITLTAGRETRHIELVAGTSETIVLPPLDNPPYMPLRIRTSDGFVPADTTPGSDDRRLLGVWIAFVREEPQQAAK